MLRIIAFAALLVSISVAGCASAEIARQPAKTPTNDAPEKSGEAWCRGPELCAAPNVEMLCIETETDDYALQCLVDESAQELVKAAKVPSTHPAIHGPYSISMLLDFIAPSKEKLDEAYGIDSRFLIRAFENIYLGGTIGYARMKHEDREGLLKGEIQRYTSLFWCEYRFRLGDTTWSPSVDAGIGLGWFFGEAVPMAERRQDIESTGAKLRTSTISNCIMRFAVQLRLPVHRSTDISISEGNADVVIGIGGEYGEGRAKYTINDFAAGEKIVSKGALALDSFHVFIGLSFRF